MFEKRINATNAPKYDTLSELMNEIEETLKEQMMNIRAGSNSIMKEKNRLYDV